MQKIIKSPRPGSARVVRASPRQISAFVAFAVAKVVLVQHSVIEQGSAWNTCSLNYLFRLVPSPRRLESFCLLALATSGLRYLLLALSLGNMYFIANKPM